MKYLLTLPKAARRAAEVIAALVVAVVAIPECQAADLGVWFAVDQGNGTAGSAYYPLQFH